MDTRSGGASHRDGAPLGARTQPQHREIDRDQHPVGRIGRPEDIAEAVAYLHQAGFVTGQHLNIDGGMTAKMIYEH